MRKRLWRFRSLGLHHRNLTNLAGHNGSNQEEATSSVAFFGGAARHERGGSGADRLSRRRVDERLSDRFHRISRDGKNAGGAHSTHQETDRNHFEFPRPLHTRPPVRPTPRLTPSLGKKLKLGFFCASSTIQESGEGFPSKPCRSVLGVGRPSERQRKNAVTSFGSRLTFWRGISEIGPNPI